MAIDQTVPSFLPPAQDPSGGDPALAAWLSGQTAPVATPPAADTSGTTDQNEDGVIDEKDIAIQALQDALKKILGAKATAAKKSKPKDLMSSVNQNAEILSEKYEQPTPPFIQ